MSLEPNGLRVKFGGGERDEYLLDSLELRMRGAAATLKEHIEQATQLRPWVQAVVVIWGDFEARQAEGDRVVYVAGDRLSAWLRNHGEVLPPRNRRLIQGALEADLVAPPAPAAQATSRP